MCNLINDKLQCFKNGENTVSKGMNLLKSFLILAISTSTASAYFQKLYTGFKTSDTETFRGLKSKEMKESVKAKEGKYPWSLSLEKASQDSFTQSLYSFNSQRTMSDVYTLSLQKQTYKFGSFSLTYQEIFYDLSEWSPSALSSFSSDEAFESKYSLGYQYEILNKKFSKEWEQVDTEKKLVKEKSLKEREEQAYLFFVNYVKAKRQVYQVRLYTDSLKRAQDRLRVAKRRVRDGLSKKVDLYLSESSLLDQKEALVNAKVSLDEDIAKLESIVGYKIPKTLIDSIGWDEKKDFTFKGTLEQNKELRALKLESKKSVIDTEIEKALNDHKLTFGIQYAKNSISEDEEEFRDELQENSFEDKKAYLKYTINFGGANSALQTKKKIAKRRAALAYDLKQSDIQNRYEHILKMQSELKSLFNNAVKRETLLRKYVKGIQRQYRQGQSRFDDILRAEDQLNNSITRKYEILYSLELLTSEFSYLTGNILTYLDSYKD